MKWGIYKSVTGSLVSQASCMADKKERRKRGFIDYVLKTSLLYGKLQKIVSSYDIEALHSEMDWGDLGYTTYFAESPELLEMLWHAKMDVDIDDLGLEEFPRCFSIAWPECEIGGHKLTGCLVWWGRHEDRMSLVHKFDKRVFGKPMTEIQDDTTGLNMHLYYLDSDSNIYTGEALYRSKISGADIKRILSSQEEFSKESHRGNPTDLIFGLSQNETSKMYALHRMVIRLMVYMRACPHMVREGYPEGRKAREFNTHWTNLKPSVVHHPAGPTEHGSPVAHWRTWHFRSYPRRKDGTKQAGIVFVSGTVVGAKLEPVTVS